MNKGKRTIISTALHRQLQLPSPGARFTIQTVPTPKPSRTGVAVRIKAIGLNPIDWKSAQTGFRVPASSWPAAVLGTDIAGVVEAVGVGDKEQQGGETDDDGTTTIQEVLQVGDEVFGVARGDTPEGAGAFQEVCTASRFSLAKKPASLSFEEAATIPVCIITAAAAIVVGLKIPLPGLGTTQLDQATAPNSVLVLGGSSVVGASVVQLLRLALGPSARIVATSAPGHHTFLTAHMGATACLDRVAQGDVAALRRAGAPATSDAADAAAGYDAIVDAVGACAQQPQVLDALRSDGLRMFAEGATGSGTSTPVPEGVTSTLIIGHTIFNTDGGKDFFRYVAKLVAEGQFKVAAKVDMVGNGLEAVEAGLEKLRKGVSGAKLVVTL